MSQRGYAGFMRAVALSLVVLALLAGCVDPEAETPVETAPDVVIDKDRPDPVFGNVETGPAVGPDLNATTQAPPRLVVGEWWRIRYENTFLDEGAVEFVRVVADAHDEGYVVGMPHEGWYKEAIAYHSPAFGDIDLQLAYNTHNVRFEAIRFPLVAGATWETAFATQPYIAEVESADMVTAVVVLTPATEPEPTDPLMALLGLAGGGTMRVTFDARMHEVVRMETDFGAWEVIEHGYDYRGWVTVPRGEHTAIDYGRFGPVSDTHTPLEADVVVEGGFNRMTLMHLVGGVGPGSYEVRSVAPNGTEFVTEATGVDPFVIAFHEAIDPDGTWTVQDRLLGAGYSYSMGIAYHQYDIKVPEGLRRADHSHPVIR